jgi:ubiquinone/menaquinone biosynthesis C-methylase UbiE
MTVGQRFARLVTQLVVRAPFLWRVFRRPMTRQFDRLAPEWDSTRVSRERLVAMLAALDAVPDAQRILDVGTGSGAVARLLAERWPAAQVTGVDVSPAMVEEARRLGGGEHYDVGDAASLPYPDSSFDLLTLNNMIPFFDELARVTAPGGHVAIAYSMGDRTPIWVPLERVRAALEERGFLHVADFRAGSGVALLARRS